MLLLRVSETILYPFNRNSFAILNEFGIPSFSKQIIYISGVGLDTFISLLFSKSKIRSIPAAKPIPGVGLPPKC